MRHDIPRKRNRYGFTLDLDERKEAARNYAATSTEGLEGTRTALIERIQSADSTIMTLRKQLQELETAHDRDVDRIGLIDDEVASRFIQFRRGDTVQDEFGVVYRVTKAGLHRDDTGNLSITYDGIRLSKTGIEQGGERPILSPHLTLYQKE